MSKVSRTNDIGSASHGRFSDIRDHRLRKYFGTRSQPKRKAPHRRMDTQMNDSTTGNDKNERSKEFGDSAYMIPGVDGFRQFGFPNKIITKLRYGFTVSTAALSNETIIDYVFRMNSIQDPDFTGTGHQPLWHDTYSTVYETYRVLGSQLTVTFTPSVYSYNGTFGPYIIGVTGNRLSTSALGYSNVQQLMESADTTYDVIGLDSARTITLDYSPASRLGTSATEDTVGASVGSNPPNTYFGHCWVVQQNGNTTPATTGEVQLTGHIDMTVEFYNLLNPSAS